MEVRALPDLAEPVNSWCAWCDENSLGTAGPKAEQNSSACMSTKDRLRSDTL
jgi:hypothetical protein